MHNYVAHGKSDGNLAVRLLHIAVCGIGFVICFAAYYPGVLSPDSLHMYRQAHDFSFNDWHSPIFPLLWAPLISILGGAWGMLFVLLALYWGALFVLAEAAAQIDRRAAPAMVALGFMPFAINFVGTMWADVLVATSWLMCVALVFAADVHGRRMSAIGQIAVWTLFLIGSWARANAIFAAVPLGLYLLDRRGAFSLTKRAVLAALLLCGLWVGNWSVTYPILGARKTHPINMILTYDLGGISHFSGKNYFPSTWSDAESAEIISSCYTPQAWNEYAWGRCRFVAERLRANRLWGSAVMWQAWITALNEQPLAYLRHRWAHFAYFTTTVEYVFHEGQTEDEIRQRLKENFGFKFLRNYVFGTHRLWMFRPIFWIILAAGCLLAANRCPSPSRRFVTAVSLSAITYLATYFFVGVASNFRYAYWAVLATSACAVILACELAAALTRRLHRSTEPASR